MIGDLVAMKTEDLMNEFKVNLDYYFSDVLNHPFARPHWIFFSLSHRCNFNCQMCGVRGILKNYELDIKLIRKSLEEVAQWGSDHTVLFTGGEVFLRKDIFEIIEHSTSLGLKTEVVTNGSLIDNANMAGRLMDSGLSNIAVSLDGATAQTHDSIRSVPGAYDKAIQALELLSGEKRKKQQGPQISVWTTIMKENIHELYEIIHVARKAGVECLVYHPVIVAQEDMQNTIKGGNLWVMPELLGVLKDEIDKIADYRREHGLVAFLHDPYQWLGYFQGALTKADWKCNPFVFIDIGPDGAVRSCGPSFGNIKEMSLQDCLQTDKARKARERMRACQKPCLQTCWARPEADSLEKTVNNFISQIDNSSLPKEEKKAVLAEGIRAIDEYENIILSKRQ